VYDEFFSKFSDPKALNESKEDDIRDVIRPLGFVNQRTRTFREVGEVFCKDYRGEVPNSLDQLKRPWRVGDYSARACQLFARGEPLALVDANFSRVIGRIFGYDMPRQPHKSEEVYALLESLVPSDPPLARAFNLAILDLGALICTPSSPACSTCPINAACYYYDENRSE